MPRSFLIPIPVHSKLFERLPGVFWFDQLRNLATPPSPSGENAELENSGRVSYQVGVGRLRQHLNRWQLNRLTRGPARHDFLQELENSYKRVFPGRSFGMPEPMYRFGVRHRRIISLFLTMESVVRPRGDVGWRTIGLSHIV